MRDPGNASPSTGTTAKKWEKVRARPLAGREQGAGCAGLGPVPPGTRPPRSLPGFPLPLFEPRAVWHRSWRSNRFSNCLSHSSSEPRGTFTYPGHLQLHRVGVSPVHEGGIHFAAHAQATVSVVYVKAASTAFLETDAGRTCHHAGIPHCLPQCLARINTARVPVILADDGNKPYR